MFSVLWDGIASAKKRLNEGIAWSASCSRGVANCVIVLLWWGGWFAPLFK